MSVRLFAAAVAVAALAGLCLQTALSVQAAVLRGEGPLNGIWRLSNFFTIWSNSAVAIVASALALAPRSALAAPLVRLSVVPSIVVAGALFTLLLRGTFGPQTVWQTVASAMLHDITPIGMALLWLASLRARHGWSAAVAVLVLPAAYLCYSLGRGVATGFFPYWFLDPEALAPSTYLRNVALLAIGFVAMGLLLVAVSRWRPGVEQNRLAA